MTAVSHYIDTESEEAMYDAIEEDRSTMLALLTNEMVYRLIDEGVLEKDDDIRASELRDVMYRSSLDWRHWAALQEQRRKGEIEK